jgi:hypothetical protein
MGYFDFSIDVQQAVTEAHQAKDPIACLCAKTTIHKAKFAGAIRSAGFRLLSRGDSFVPGEHDLVIGTVAWSDPELAALENLVFHQRSGTVRISVFDLDNICSTEDLIPLLPGIRTIRATPVVLEYRNGEITYFGQGAEALAWLRQLPLPLGEGTGRDRFVDGPRGN